MDHVIEIKNLKKTYKSTIAVNGTSFSVKKGEIFGILGPNGAGKTTTLEIIEGLKQQSSGEIHVLGFNNLQNPLEIKKRIGVQLQSSDYLPLLTLGELLKLFGSIYQKQINPKNLLKLVDLEAKEQEQVKNLSGGQKQRFTIATSLVNDPEILFLDEPTTGLDPVARHSLWDLIKKINQDGITVVLTTHYMEEAEFLCNRVAIMDQGQILKIDEPQKLISNLSHTTQISFFTPKPFDESIFKDLPQITKIHSHHPKTILEVSTLENISPIIYTLKKNNVSFSGFTLKTASLEDVYLQLTGKEYSDS